MEEAYDKHKIELTPAQRDTDAVESQRGQVVAKTIVAMRKSPKSLTQWFSKNHQWLSSLMVVIGLPATVISLGLTREQMNTAQDNFKEEMSVQRKATAAVLFNDFLKSVINLEANPQDDATAQEKALDLLAKQADFIIRGTGDSSLRSNVLSFISEKYSDMLIPVPTENGFDAAVKLSGQEYTGEITGKFNHATIANSSFPETRFQNVSFDKAHVQYSHFQDAVFYNFSMNSTTLRCASFNGATLNGKSDISGVDMQNVDLRGVKVIRSTGNLERVVLVKNISTLLMSAGVLNSVLVDDDVYDNLVGKKPGITKHAQYPYSHKFSFFRRTSPEQWISNAVQQKLCG